MAESVSRASFQTEAAIIDQVPLVGRKAELRQFLKALNLCRTGQGKAFLLCGNEGIGKSALLNACLDLVQSTSAGYTLRLTAHPRLTPEAMFAQTVNEILALAHQILGESLVKINNILTPLGMRWTQSELMQMVALLRLQDAVTRRNTDAALEQLTQTIYGAIPFFKRFDASIKPQIRGLAEVLFDPWVTLAVSLTNPINPQVQQALNLVDRLLGGSVGNTPLLSFQQAGLPLLPGAMQEPASESAFMPAPPPETEHPEPRHLQNALVELLGFINQGLRPHNTCLVIAVDQWEAVAETPMGAIKANQELLTEVIRQVIDQRDARLMLMVCCRSEKESYALGGSLYPALKSKLLVAPLADTVQEKLLQQALTSYNIATDASVTAAMAEVCKGNPALAKLFTHHITQDFPQSGLPLLDEETYQLRYEVVSPTDLLEMAFTRLQLSFTGSDEAMLKTLNQIISAYGYQPFTVDQALRLVSGQPEQTSLVPDLIAQLAQSGFLTRDQSHYQFVTAFALSLLKRKIRPVQRDLSRQEKVSSLKKVLPLSFQSGELTKEKTQELLAMAQAMETPDFGQFIEENLLQVLADSETPLVTRLAALESLPLLGTKSAIEALLNATQSSEQQVRACACTQLIPLAGRVGLALPKEAIAQAITPLLNDASPEVMEAAYQVLAVLPGNSPQLLNTLLQGSRHPNPAIGLLCVASIERRRWKTPETFERYQSLLLASSDSHPEGLKLALKGLGQFPPEQVTPVLIAYLETHPQNEAWHDVIGVLMNLDLTTALPWVVSLLTDSGRPDWKLSMLKRLGSRQTPDAQRILIQVLQNTPTGQFPAEVRWMAIRSLGWIGYSDEALQALYGQRAFCGQDEILMQTLESAIRQVSERFGTSRPVFRTQESEAVTQPDTPELMLSTSDSAEG